MAQAKKKDLDTGRKAPMFRLKDADDAWVSSKDLEGVPYVLYFYPRADTPGCTTETCAFRDALPDFTELEVQVLGVSPDEPKKQARFRDKYEVPFRLLCDTEHKLAEAYGCWKEKKNYGRTYMGIERSTFLIDADGTVCRVWRKVKVKDHVAEVQAAAEELL